MAVSCPLPQVLICSDTSCDFFGGYQRRIPWDLEAAAQSKEAIALLLQVFRDIRLSDEDVHVKLVIAM